MNSLVPKLLIWWMAATMAHVPFPVCDGDEFGSCPECFLGASTAQGVAEFDLDFVLLGCERPYDDEQGPFGHRAPDRDLGEGLFPVCLPARAVADSMAPRCVASWDSWACQGVLAWHTGLRCHAELPERSRADAAARKNPAAPVVLRC